MEEVVNTEKIQLIVLNMIMEMDKICRRNNLKYYLAYGSVLGAVRHKGFIPWDEDIDIIVDIDSYKIFCDTIRSEIGDEYRLYSIDEDPEYDSLKARISPTNIYHHLIHIDIFPIVGVPKSIIGSKLFSKICYIIYRSYFVKKVNVNVNYMYNRRKRITTYMVKLLLKLIPSSFLKLIFYKLSTLYPIQQSDIIYNICGSYGYKELMPKKYLGEPVLLEFEGIALPIPEKWHQYLTHIYGDYMTPKQANYV